MGYVSNVIIGISVMALSAADFACDSYVSSRAAGAAKRIIHERTIEDDEALISDRNTGRIVDGVLFVGGAAYTMFGPKKRYVRLRDRKPKI